MGSQSIGERVLDSIIDEHGPDAVQAAVGTWIANQHRDRARLLMSRDRKPARAPHYLAFVRQLPCCVCGSPEPNDPHHWGPRGMGSKTDDFRTVPLCRRCHDRIHDGRDQCKDFNARIVNTLVKYLRIVEGV